MWSITTPKSPVRAYCASTLHHTCQICCHTYRHAALSAASNWESHAPAIAMMCMEVVANGWPHDVAQLISHGITKDGAWRQTFVHACVICCGSPKLLAPCRRLPGPATCMVKVDLQGFYNQKTLQQTVSTATALLQHICGVWHLLLWHACQLDTANASIAKWTVASRNAGYVGQVFGLCQLGSQLAMPSAPLLRKVDTTSSRRFNLRGRNRTPSWTERSVMVDA
jgi:hypothetical protein